MAFWDGGDVLKVPFRTLNDAVGLFSRRAAADASKGTFEALTVPKVPFRTRGRQPKHRRSMP
jgi:hypothetical protein